MLKMIHPHKTQRELKTVSDLMTFQRERDQDQVFETG